MDLHDLAAERVELLGTPSDIYWVEINHNACGGLREKRFKHRSAAYSHQASHVSSGASPRILPCSGRYVGITTGVKLRGPERSEGHVSFNGRVRQHLGRAS
jgi:hypothetical protein